MSGVGVGRLCSMCEATTGRRLGGILGGVFLLALVLGPGPGAGWVAGSAEEPRILWGVPALYLWVVF